MPYSFSIYSIPLVAAALVSGALSAYSWRQRKTSGAASFSLMMALLFSWGLTYNMQVSSTTIEAMTFWQDITFISVVLTPTAWLLFALEYTGKQEWINRFRLKYSLFLIPIITLLVIASNPTHNWFWISREMVPEGGIYVINTENGFWFWYVHAVYSYLCMVSGAFFLTRTLLKWPAEYRWQMIWVLLAISVPFIANILTVFKLVPIRIDLTPFAFTITGMGMALALFRHRLLELVPIARDIVIDNMRDGMLVLDASNRVVDMNPAAYRVLDLPENTSTIGKTIAEVLVRWPHLIERYRDVVEGKDEVSLDDGENRRWYEFTLSPLRDRRNNLVGRVIVARDITQVKETQQVLQMARDKAIEASLAKSHLLAKVSHELRTPLGGILGFAELLQSGTFGTLSEQQKRAAGEIVQSANYLNSMVSELLDQAQIESNAIVLQKKSFNLAEFIEQATGGLSFLAGNKGLHLESIIDPSMPEEIRGDDYRLRQVIINLAGNAIKFTKKGRVTIKVARKDELHWQIQIIDTGTGIAPEAQPFIFDPFRQADNAMTRENRGIGLGLSITRQLVEMMGGQISLESEVGRGSTFTVTLPLEQAA